MSRVYVSADSWTDITQTTEAAYFYGGGPTYSPVIIDSGDGQQDTFLPASNTRTFFSFGGALYKMVTRQPTFVVVMLKSTDGGVTWNVLNVAGSPTFESCSGYFDAASSTVICAYVSATFVAAPLRLIVFDLITGTWGTVLAPVGPTAEQNIPPVIYKRNDGTYIVLYTRRLTVTGSALSAVSYNPSTQTWGVPFDAGANITLLPGWDATQTGVDIGQTRSVMDESTGIIHVIFATTSLQVVPVIWGNRVFYQAINLNNGLGSFFDFPGQVAPFPAAPYNQQQLNVFSGPPFGNPVIVGNNILLPVSVRNDSVIDRFPHTLPSLYLGTPVSAPVWALATPTDPQATIDPGTIINDLIWIQEAPCLVFDGQTMYAVYTSQADDGTNNARMRLCQSTNTTAPQDSTGWTASTIFDFTVSAPPGFNFVGQFLSGAGVFAPSAFAPTQLINARGLPIIPLPNLEKCK